jgi:hypothetical protein
MVPPIPRAVLSHLLTRPTATPHPGAIVGSCDGANRKDSNRGGALRLHFVRYHRFSQDLVGARLRLDGKALSFKQKLNILAYTLVIVNQHRRPPFGLRPFSQQLQAKRGTHYAILRLIEESVEISCLSRIDGLHKAQLASDRMSCHSANANQVRLEQRPMSRHLRSGIAPRLTSRSLW